MPVLDTVWRFLTTKSFRFFLDLSPMDYGPYKTYYHNTTNALDEGKWEMRFKVFLSIEKVRFDDLLASLFPFTVHVLGESPIEGMEWDERRDMAEAIHILNLHIIRWKDGVQ